MATIRNIKLTDLTFSATEAQIRRRKSFSSASLQELAESLKTFGLLQPIVVRTTSVIRGGDRTEDLTVVAGERRCLAAELAGWDTVPAIVRTMTDAEVVEIQLIENLQRLDLDPMQEAEGYEQLNKDFSVPIEEIHHRVGKSRAYVYNRIKLLSLGKKVRKALNDGTITLSVALLLARIPTDKLQDEALQAIACTTDPGSVLSKQAAYDIIEDEFMLRLKNAPFPTDDEQLLPSATSCGRCPKRTGNQAELFDDVKDKDVCLDRQCFGNKTKAFGKRQLKQAKIEGKPVIEGAAAKKIFPWRHGRALRTQTYCSEVAHR